VFAMGSVIQDRTGRGVAGATPRKDFLASGRDLG
jgi:hypothetical protein